MEILLFCTIFLVVCGVAAHSMGSIGKSSHRWSSVGVSIALVLKRTIGSIMEAQESLHHVLKFFSGEVDRTLIVAALLTVATLFYSQTTEDLQTEPTAAKENSEGQVSSLPAAVEKTEATSVQTTKRIRFLDTSPSQSLAFAFKLLQKLPAIHRKIGKFRKAAATVGKCCSAFLESEMLQKCVSTALSLGDTLHRGSNRVPCAIVLPDSLLKLEELHGNQGEDKGSAKSLLDIVAQSVVNDKGFDLGLFCQQAVTLLALTKDAQAVCLEDVESSCRTLAGDIKSVSKSLSKIQAKEPSRHVDRLIDQVQCISKELEVADNFGEFVKMQLGQAQRWSSAKSNANCDEWLLGWRQVLEQLPKAFARAQPLLVPA